MLKSRHEVLALKGFFFSFFFLSSGQSLGDLDLVNGRGRCECIRIVVWYGIG